MARNGKVNVKLPTKKVIAALEKALAKLESDYRNQEKLDVEFKKKVNKWKKLVLIEAIKNVSKVKEDDCSINERYDGSYNVHLFFPAGMLKTKEPVREHPLIAEWEYRNNKEELENNLRILKMTEDEYINASTYNAVTKYL